MSGRLRVAHWSSAGNFEWNLILECYSWLDAVMLLPVKYVHSFDIISIWLKLPRSDERHSKSRKALRHITTKECIHSCPFSPLPVTYVEQVLKELQQLGYGSLATVVGRYYAMDRDKRWERIKIAYEGLVQGSGQVTSADKVLEVCTVDNEFNY